jgi:HemY protein
MRPKTPWVLTNLLELQVRAGEWQNAQATLGEAIKAKLVPVGSGRHHQAALLLAQSRAAEDDAARALSLAGEAQDLAPDFAPAAARRAQLLQRAGNQHKAAKAIETAWRRAPHPLLAEAYAALVADEPPLARVKRSERLAALTPDHVESRLVVAQAALAAQLWGEARRQLAAIVSPLGDASPGADARPAARICRLMAALEEAEHGDGAAARVWLARAAEAPPDPLWICNSCAAESRDWQPLCPRCRRFDSLAWQVPARAVTSLPEHPSGRPVVLLPAAAPPDSEKAARWPSAAAPAALAATSAPVDVGRG